MLYSVSEWFSSIQGEGHHVGRLYFFLRLGGCNVGRYIDPPVSSQVGSKDFPLLQSKKHSICTTFDKQEFLCDTDYHSFSKMTPEEIIQEIRSEKTLCITGGEPLLHNLNPLLEALPSSITTVAIETSGTLALPQLTLLPHVSLWVTCCPKSISGKTFEDSGGIDVNDVDEWKILVGPKFKESELEKFEVLIPSTCEHRFLQPINGVNDIWQVNVDKCLDLLRRWPHWRLSLQSHKFIGVR